MARILVADDAESMRDVLRSTLKFKEHDIATVQNGREAWDMLAVEPFDLLITAIAMPEMSGLELLAKIRASRESFSAMPVIVCTGRDRDVREEFIAARADAVIFKPISPVKLLEMTDFLLNS
jgi:CheY-like chemotaxis protein